MIIIIIMDLKNYLIPAKSKAKRLLVQMFSDSYVLTSWIKTWKRREAYLM